MKEENKTIIRRILLLVIVLTFGMTLGSLMDMYYKPYKIYPNHASSDYIKENNIHINNNSVCIDIENPSISRYAATGSMQPTLDENANGIRIPVNNSKDIKLGDIITFKRDDDFIIHRVIEIGYDSIGWYCITRGDYNVINDGKIRLNEISSKTIMIIY